MVFIYNLSHHIARRAQESSRLLWRHRCSNYHSGKGVYGHRPELPPFETIAGNISEEADHSRNAAANFFRLVENFRAHGHRVANVNPLSTSTDPDKSGIPEIDVHRYKFNNDQFSPKGIVFWKSFEGKEQVAVNDGIDLLRKTYTGQTGFEFMHMESEAEREWFASQVESTFSDPIPDDYRVKLGLEMAKFQNFDHFLASKFPNLKRYGGEGCESMLAIFLEMLRCSNEIGFDHVIIGMPHRGRLNLLTGLLQFPPCRMFRKMKGLPEFPADAKASGDVLSHLYTSVAVDAGNNHHVNFSLLPNPSHLEVVNAMVVGKARAKLQQLKGYDYASPESNNESEHSSVLPVQIHGDAALPGQGINQETLGFANVEHFRVGGSLHLIVNNQIGFTTPAERGRSTKYSSDIAKMINAPVIHVNGDFPEDIVKATRIALEYRQKFHKDVFIDLMCFRKWGHNELDDPTFTNPLIYKIINCRKSIPDQYAEQLISQGLIQESQLKQEVESHTAHLNEELKKADSITPPQFYLKKQWSGMTQADRVITEWDTGVDIPVLKFIGQKSVEFPQDFNIHPHLAKTFVKTRIGRITEGEKIDWATAEALAFGSLLYQGYDIRLSGEDVGRGTFSHRHAMLVDQSSGEIFIPLNSLIDEGNSNFKLGKLEIANSTLSEEAVLAFEYGFSVEHPNNLVIWEAQFGDFFNGAQIPIDTMVVSGETKWMLQSGIVMLLPHGMDAAGPEHSSCKIERFLQLTDSSEDIAHGADGDHNNIQVVNPTTPAQYFHLLRRQMVRNFRKPLVVVAPKTLLRLSAATSNLAEMTPGTTFQPVLDDPDTASNRNQVKKLIFTSGKHFYSLREKRVELKRNDVSIVRLESLCPFPVRELQNLIKAYPHVTEIIWSQEEHQNMGAWTFIRPRFENFLGRQIQYKGRGPLAAPAVGSAQAHRAEIEHIFNTTFE